MTLTPSNCVGRLLPKKSALVQLRVTEDRLTPWIEIQVPGAIPGRKLAPFTTPIEEMEGPVEIAGFTNTQAAPSLPLELLALSPTPPTRAVFPSEDNATEPPCSENPTEPVPTNLPPCWLHAPPVRVNTHVAPTLLLS